MHYRKRENNVANKIATHYTTARANFRTFSQTDQNFRTKLKFQDNGDISGISGQLGPLHTSMTHT